MIEARFRQNEQNDFLSIEITGHAMSGKYGSDIVCAGVSAIVISMINNVSRIVGRDLIIDSDEVNGGYIFAKIPEDFTSVEWVQCQILFKACYYALSEDIQENYSKYLRVIVE